MNKKPRSINGLVLLAVLGLVLVWLIMTGTGEQTSSVRYSQIISWFEQGEVTDFTLDLKNGEMSLTLSEAATQELYDAQAAAQQQAASQPTGSLASLFGGAASQQVQQPKQQSLIYVVPATSIFLQSLPDYVAAHDAKYPDSPMTYDVLPAGQTSIWVSMLPMLIITLVVMGAFYYFVYAQGGGGKAMNVGRAKVKDQADQGRKATFADVAGADEEKEELAEIVEFLKNQQRFNTLGARIPHGVLLVGPPGTGKTLLARACAGEAGVPFYSISGSDFVEMYVGVGASRVRDLFEKAKKTAPCIVFIDEIDAVGRQRGTGLGGGHDEREQTLNQLLVEMDGFESNDSVVLIAATNRADVLDPALLRPGRFDRQVTVNYPDLEGRVDILKVHSRGKALEKDVDLENIAKRMPYSSGADLENVMNEGAILAVRRKKKKISQQDLVDAVSRVQMGPEKRSHKVTPRDRKTTAYHEAGHAVIANLLPECDDVHLVTIVPRGQAGGYTLSLPSEENDNYSRTALLGMVTMALGGHAAEHVSLDDIYTGASSDIKRATELCRRMVTQFGMSDSIGTMYLGSDQEVFVGMEFGQSREYSEQSAAAIDQEVKRLLDECYARACKLLKDHMDKLVAVAEALLERDTLTRADFECVMRGEPLPPMTDVEKMQPSSEAQADPTPDAQTDGAVTPGFATQDAQEDGDPFVEPKDGE